MNRRVLTVVACYATVYLAWGGTYFFIRRSVETIPPFYVIGIRWSIGGLMFLIIAFLGGRLRRLPPLRDVLFALLLGSLLLIGGNGLVTVGEQRVDSYIAALLASSIPILVALLDRVLLRRHLTPLRLLGILAGFSGVALLLYNGRSIGSSLNSWILVTLGGIGFWSLATSLGHRFLESSDNLVSSAIQMTFVGIVCLVAGLLFSASPAEVAARMSVRSLVGLSYLAIVGSVAFVAYTYLIGHEPTERVVSYAFVNPLIAVMLGLLFGGESANPLLWVGLPLILLGLAFMFYGKYVKVALRALGRREQTKKPG
jgi:drug/metabolite transporter (DMT)-like permease